MCHWSTIFLDKPLARGVQCNVRQGILGSDYIYLPRFRSSSYKVLLSNLYSKHLAIRQSETIRYISNGFLSKRVNTLCSFVRCQPNSKMKETAQCVGNNRYIRPHQSKRNQVRGSLTGPSDYLACGLLYLIHKVSQVQVNILPPLSEATGLMDLLAVAIRG